MSEPYEVAVAARAAVGLFARADRGLVEVRGSERVRWLNGMISRDVAALANEGDGSSPASCEALLLTPKGRVVADLLVIARPDALWLSCARAAIAPALEQLARFIVADDVDLVDVSEEWRCFALEGPRAAALVGALEADGVVAARVGDVSAGRYELRVAVDEAAAVRAALDVVGSELGLVEGDDASFQVLRIEAGRPAYGCEIDEVLPAEAGLEHALSLEKGCYTGQEIVARVHSRGRVNRSLVGLAFESGPPAGGSLLTIDGAEVGRATSTCTAASGPIGLGIVRREHTDLGTLLECDGVRTSVVGLPHEGRSAARG